MTHSLKVPRAQSLRHSGETELAYVLGQLPDAQRSGNGYKARCPVHDDRVASLSVSEGTDGRALVHCHAGCEQAAVVRALNLGSHAPRTVATPERRTVATYTYTDRDGRPVHYRDRVEWFEGGEIQKAVYPRRLDGTKGGTASVPYRLHQVAATIPEGGTVILVEGEKAADALHERGYIATTTGSATSWRRHFAEHFRDARMVIWPDADAPGERYIADAASDLAGMVAELRVLRFPDKPKGWDAADYFAEGGTEEQLDHLLADAPFWEGLADIERAPGDAIQPPLTPREEQARRAIRFLTIKELAAIPEPRYRIDGVLVDNSFAAIIGMPQTYKSFLALSMGLSIAVGLDWFGRPVRQGPVAYIVGEGTHGIVKRIEAWRLHNRLPDVGGLHVLLRAAKLSEPIEGAAVIEALLALDEPPVAVFVDTLQRTFLGNENSQEDMGAYVAACDRIREATGAAVVLVHHTGWEGVRSRGSIVLPASLDTELTVKRDGERVTVEATKQKDGPDGLIVTLETVAIGGSLALAPVEPLSPKLSANERKVLAAVSHTALGRAQIMAETGLVKASVHRALERLVALAYVKKDASKYVSTDAGRLALGSGFHGGSNLSSSEGGEGVPRPHVSKDMRLEPPSKLEAA